MLHRLASSQGGLRVRSAAGMLMLVLATSACVAQPARNTPVTQVSAPKAQQGQVEFVELRAGELPNVALTGSVLFRLLAADISVQRGELVKAAGTFLELARETTDPRLAQRAVELYAALGDLPGALESAKVWVSNAPNDEEAQSTRMSLSAAAGQTYGLVDELAKQIIQASNKTEAMARAMGVLNRMQDRALALRLMAEVIEKSKTRGTLAAYMALADMAQAAGDHQRALVEARAALRIKPDSEDAAMRVLDYGMTVDPNTAIADGQRFARANPKSRQLRLMLAGKLAEIGDVGAALEELRLMSVQFPEDFDLLFIRAQLAYRDKRLKEADRLLQEYVDVQSQRQDALAAGASDAGVALADAYTLLSRIAQDQGDAERAIALLGKIEDPNARYPARLRQATIRAGQGRVDEAIRMIDAAHSGDQDEQLVGVLTLTRILREAERYDQAIERLLKADEDIQNSVEIKYELGMLLERQKRYVEMEKYIRQVIELDPGYAHAYNALGYSLADRNERLKEADELIERAYQILPQDPHILDSVGWVKFRLGDNVQAEKYLRAAFEQMPQAEVAAHLGEVLWVQGRHDDAREIWRQGQELEPGNAVLQDTMRRFGVSP